MKLLLQHIEIHVSSVEKAKDFYVTKLGLDVLEDRPELNLLALRAGDVRISIFGGYTADETAADTKTGTHIIFRTADIEATVAELQSRAVIFSGGIFEAPGFLRGISTTDPDGNTIEIAQYLRDPLATVN